MASEEPRAPEWSCGDVLRLIREYGNRPELWDPECEDYKNRFRKHHKWLELAAIFKCGKLEVERKMKILNSQYRRERLKAARMRKSGKTHVVTWYGYKGFAFMNKRRNRANPTNADGVHTIKQESKCYDDFNAGTPDLMPLMEDDNDHTLATGVKENDAVLENTHNDSGQTSQKDGVIKILYDNKDEWTLFGELVAHAFRKLPDDRTRCIVRHKINTILFEAELATYDG